MNEKKIITDLESVNVKFLKHSKVIIPNEIVETLGLHEGDDLICRLKDGKIVMEPLESNSEDQSWFWTERWQEEELEAEQQIKDGKVSESKSLEDTLNDLDKISKR